jgi:hypothetical protein
MMKLNKMKKISSSTEVRMMAYIWTFKYVLSRGVSTDMMPLYCCTCSESAVEILSSIDHCTHVRYRTVRYGTVQCETDGVERV